ncbi:alpha/beta fold hydrolase [Amycolatopsis sp. FDAARGOS 1241]|uniref:alpha/beta fold hydrolase n=1 Tax=Amycolatopsis sp. FDAARGOS 1241 TaxID=2778070 RepID=UPI00194E14E9|nr:alpha/beta fold hydrolase [Amycolatopsis sp. FDAARGOS 1241]QRP43465.1 alpha/beta hydrolase [Amycolatopsis sp. FDAARGOS 1241]
MSTTDSVAAAVTYRLAEAPSSLHDFHAPEGVSLQYYEITSLDGRSGPAAHLVPAEPLPDAPLVLSVHGSGGSIGSRPVRTLALGLSARGVPVLAINTRQSGEAVNTDNYYATVRDVEAAYWTARALGYSKIVLHGHSLGTSQVSLFAATHWHETTAGVVLTGMFADLPWKSRHLLINDEATYRALTEEAVAAVRAGDFGRTLSTEMSWLGGRSVPVTAQHFLTYRRTGIAGARSLDWVARVPNPILMLRDEHDTVIHDFEPGWLEAALEHGLSPSVTSVSLPSPEGTEGHRFDGSSESLVDTVAGWLAKLG